MIATLPPWLTDLGAVIGIALAACLLLAALAGAAALGVRYVTKPSIDAIRDLLDAHMDIEERQMDRIAIALEIISRTIGVKIPTIRVSGGSDAGDDEQDT